MIIELRHDIKGAFGETYVEERTTCTDDETVKLALNTLRRERNAVMWIEEVGDVNDSGSITGICVSWETFADYDAKQVLVTTYYGAGNISDYEYMDWNRARNYLKKFIKNA